MGIEKSGDVQYQKDIILRREVIKHNRNIRESLQIHGTTVRNKLQKITSTGPRSGRFYSFRGRKYQASAPGEPPARRSGRLSNSFIYKTSPLQLTVANRAFADTGFNYPRFLEEELDRPYFVGTIESLHMDLYRDLQSLN